MTKASPRRFPTTTDLAIGSASVAHYRALAQFGVSVFLETGSLTFDLRFIDPATGTFWTATSTIMPDGASSEIRIDYWNARDTGEPASDEDVRKAVVDLGGFHEFASRARPRILVSALD